MLQPHRWSYLIFCADHCSARDVLDKLVTGLSQVKDTSVVCLVSCGSDCEAEDTA